MKIKYYASAGFCIYLLILQMMLLSCIISAIIFKIYVQFLIIVVAFSPIYTFVKKMLYYRNGVLVFDFERDTLDVYNYNSKNKISISFRNNTVRKINYQIELHNEGEHIHNDEKLIDIHHLPDHYKNSTITKYFFNDTEIIIDDLNEYNQIVFNQLIKLIYKTGAIKYEERTISDSHYMI